MQEYKKPLFQKGRVLKKEGLDSLRDFPYRFAEGCLSGWSDGILFGFDISYEKETEKNGQLVVDSGAVWYKGQVILTERETFSFSEFDRLIIVKLYIFNDSYTEDFYVCPLEIRLETEEANGDGIELGRFRLSQGARLRKDYQDMHDFHTEYNTLDVTHVPYAGSGGITISPVILQVFARMLMESGTDKEADISFALMCLNHLPVSRECLLRYISCRLRKPYHEMEHSEIYESLVQIVGSGNRGIQHRQRKDGPAVF